MPGVRRSSCGRLRGRPRRTAARCTLPVARGSGLVWLRELRLKWPRSAPPPRARGAAHRAKGCARREPKGVPHTKQATARGPSGRSGPSPGGQARSRYGRSVRRASVWISAPTFLNGSRPPASHSACSRPPKSPAISTVVAEEPDSIQVNSGRAGGQERGCDVLWIVRTQLLQSETVCVPAGVKSRHRAIPIASHSSPHRDSRRVARQQGDEPARAGRPDHRIGLCRQGRYVHQHAVATNDVKPVSV